MSSPSTVLTLGLGSFSNANLLLMLGFAGAIPVVMVHPLSIVFDPSGSDAGLDPSGSRIVFD